MTTTAAVLLGLALASAAIAQPPPAFRQDVAWSPDGHSLAWSEFSRVVPDTTPTWNLWIATSVGTMRRRVVANALWVDWSNDGRRLVYSSQRGGNWDVYSAKPDGSDERRLTDDPAQDRQPAWSPRGDRVAFVSDRDGTQALYVMAADGSNVHRLASDSTAADNPAWSPDGSRIVWYARDAGHRDRLHVVSADGSGEAIVPTTDAGAIYASFLPNGRLLYSAVTPAHRTLLTSVAPDGSGQAVVGGIETFFARASRDGRRIAFISGAWPRSRVCVARADGSAARVVIGDPRE